MSLVADESTFRPTATPPLDWFGVKQGLYPGWVHEGVTVLLEKILLELSDVYQKTLERNAC